MQPSRTHRRIAVILNAGVKGFSGLLTRDEVGTLERLKNYRELFGSCIALHGGRVLDTPGDNVIAEFPNVVGAAHCALQVQREIQRQNDAASRELRMQFRIGIHVGEVIDDGGKIHGEGVSTASQIERLANAGGICLSSSAEEQLKGKIENRSRSLGKFELKNGTHPVRLFELQQEASGGFFGKTPSAAVRRWRAAAIAAIPTIIIAVSWEALWNQIKPSPPASPPAAQTSSPPPENRPPPPVPDDRPSIAVLPFDNLTGDPNQEYFADAFTEEIITTLSKVPDLLVIARNSTFTYKGKAVSVKQVATELGVRFVLEGSVQRSGDQVRINAQLIDAIADHHLWAEQYDRKVEGLFDLQDELTQEIMISLQVKLTEGEQLRGRHQRAVDPKAFEYYQRARFHFYKFAKEENAICRDLISEAIRISPGFPDAWRVLAYTHLMDAQYGWAVDRKASFKKAVDSGRKAYQLGPSIPLTNSLLGSIELYLRNHDKAIEYGRKAVELGPNDADATAMYGMILAYSGQPAEAVPLLQRAMRLSPLYPVWYSNMLGVAHMQTGDYEQAGREFEEAIKRDSMLVASFGRLAILSALQDNLEKARTYVGEMLKLKPSYTLQDWATVPPYRHKEDLDRELTMLRKAGLPEKAKGS